MKTLIAVGLLTLGTLVGSANAQYADFRRGMNLEDWRAGQVVRASVAACTDGGVVVLGVVSDSHWSQRLHFWKIRADGVTAWSQAWILEEPLPPVLNLVVAPDGSLVMTGAFYDSINLGGGKLVSAGYADIFLAKFAANGSHAWSRSFGSAGNDLGYQVLVHEDGTIDLAGKHTGVDFGGGVLAAADGTTLFRARFGPDGSYVGSWSFGATSGPWSINDMAISDAGDVYATGGSYFTVAFGDSVFESAGEADIITAGFDADGNRRMARHYGGEHFDTGIGIVVMPDGDIVTAGKVAGTVSLGGPELETYWLGGAFVARYTADGEHLWSRANEAFTYGASQCGAIALHPGGGVVMSGSFEDVLQFDQASLHASERTVMLLRFDDDGNFLWMGKGTGGATAMSVATTPGGHTLLAGASTSNVAFCTGDVIRTANARGFVAEFTDDPHVDTQAPPMPAHATYDGNVVRWDASPDPEGAAVRYQLDEKIWPTSIERRTIVKIPSMPLYAPESLNRFIYITAFDCFDHASATTNRLEIHPTLTGPLAPGDVRFEDGVLVWTTPTDADVVGVAVDATNAWMSTDTTRLAMTMTPGLNVENLSYRAYYLTGRDASGNWGDRAFIFDTVAPPAPTDLAYTLPMLTWSPSKDIGFSHFVVYGSASPDFPGEKAPLVATRNTRFDVPLEMRSAYYHLQQVDNSGNASAPVTVAGQGGARPAHPRELTYRDHRLHWQPPADTDIAGYNIFGSTTDASEGPRVLEGFTTGVEFDVSALDHRWYYVVAVDEVGQASEAVVISAVTGQAPSFSLSLGALPNPFRGTATLQYSIPRDGHVEIDVYDARGAHVTSLVDGSQPGGSHFVDWTAGSGDRADAASGIYFARLQYGLQSRTVKLVLLK